MRRESLISLEEFLGKQGINLKDFEDYAKDGRHSSDLPLRRAQEDDNAKYIGFQCLFSWSRTREGKDFWRKMDKKWSALRQMGAKYYRDNKSSSCDRFMELKKLKEWDNSSEFNPNMV